MPKFGEKGYSNYFECEFDESILKKHKNKEVFAIYERGFLGVCSTHFIRQNYTEVSSPFLDIDFMDMCLTIPFELRKNHNLYLKWIEKIPRCFAFCLGENKSKNDKVLADKK